MNAPVIQVTDLSKTYKLGREKVHAVHAASFALHAGELVAIVGPSGSGKTTLSQMLGGLLKPDSGQIIVDGAEVVRLRDKALSQYRNKHVGFIFQNFSLVPGYSALENVCVPLIVAGIVPRERKRRATRYLQLLGLEKHLKQKVEQLSGGQRQRMAIARALVSEPRLIIADEPTGQLDSARGKEIMQVLLRLAHSQQLTVVMVTHDTTLAAQADRQLHMRDGVLTEQANA